jgi:hypothetical protein
MSQLNRQEGVQRQKKCCQCKESFTAFNSLHIVCSVPCARARVKADKDKTERKEIRAAKERIKSKADHAREAQQAINEWIRLRDAAKPCISCGRHHQGQYHAGHYRTVGSNPELRFEPLNIHKQCAPCNNHKSGDIVNYRLSLIQRIGQASVDWLEGPHEPKRYTIEDLKSIKAEYRDKTRQIKKQIAGECA